jgi:hypothetical protein
MGSFGAGGALQAVGAELSAYGQIRAGQIAANIAEYNAQAITETAQQQAEAKNIERQLAERNAVVADQDAQFALQVAAFNEARSRTRSQALLSQGAAEVGASGVIMAGSPLATLAASAREAELDALSIRFQGELAARAKREAAVGYRYGAQLRTIEGQQALRAGERAAILARYGGSEALFGGYMAAAGTIVKSMASAASPGMGGGGSGGGYGPGDVSGGGGRYLYASP